MPTALLREVADTFDRAIVSESGRPPDVALARAQHGRYKDLLGDAGYVIEVVAADNAHPDCVFIEDTAVVLGEVAVATRPGADARRGEVEPVAGLLETRMAVSRIEAPGTIDGGDVMVLGDTVYVGRSARTNDDGIAQFDAIARSQGMSVKPVPVREVLHLKSAVIPVSNTTVVVTPGTVDESLLTGLRIIHEAPHERHAFSALPMWNENVLVTESAPATTESLNGLGLTLIPIDVSEIQAADGGLTCMSILMSD